LEESSARLAAGLSHAAAGAGIPHHVGRVGSMLTLFFNPDPVSDYEVACRSDTERFSRWFWAMMNRGVYLPCSQFEAAFVSAAHGDADIDATIAAAGDAMDEVALNN
jgi:glutamate-1-semialdehyde 2,1-aminomutase